MILLIAYPIFALTAALFWALMIATVITLRIFVWVLGLVLVAVACMIRSRWKPARPPSPLRPIRRPQAYYSDRR